MKKRLTHLFAAMLFFSQSLIGQSPCGTVLDSATIEQLRKLEPAIQQRINLLQTSQGNETESLVTIPVKFYIVRETNGSGGLQLNLLNSILNNLNTKFSGTGFYFSQCGPTEFIDNSSLYYFNNSAEDILASMGYTPGVISIYFAETVTVNGESVNGYAKLPNTNSKDIIVIRNDAATTSTTPHEVGHFFGLAHTHKLNGCPVTPPSTDELVNGCNKFAAGDFVWDTPADPGLRYGGVCQNSLVSVSGNICTYTGGNNYLDANLEPYKPNVYNLMSYAPDACRTQFTQGQKDKMVAQYQLYRSYLACPAACSQPTLAVTYITHNSAKLTWFAVSGALGYEAQIKINGSWLPLNLPPSSGYFVEIKNLIPATSYQCRMRTLCENGKSLWKESSVFTTYGPCNTPSNLATTDINDQSVKFNWAAVSGASSYIIEVRAVGSPYWNKTVSTTSTSYTFLCQDGTYISNDRGLGSNTQYEWRIRTYCNSGLYSNWSSPVSFTTIPATCNSPLPSEIVVVSATSYSVTVKCTKPGVSYQFRRSPGGFQTNASSSNIYTFSADPCTTYEIQCLVRCQSGGPYSRYSASQFVTTPNCSPCNIPAVLTTSATTYNSAIINWSSVSGAANYSIQWSLAGGSWSDLPPGTFSGTSTTVRNLQPNTAYLWRIKSNCGNGQSSAWSGAVQANTGPASCAIPLGLKTIGVLQNTATLLWAAQSGINSYTLQYWPTGGQVQEIQVTGTSKTVFNLSPNTTYQWKLKANCGANQSSAWKTGTSFVTLPVSSLSASPITQNVGFNSGSATISVSSNISWEAVVTIGASWLTLCPSSGQNNGTITATFAANPNTTSRTATVTITGSSIVKTVSIVQAGNPNPNCSNDNEPANNTIASAPTIALNTNKQSQIGSTTDSDHYKFTLTTVQNTNVTLTTLPLDYELEVYNSAGVLLGSSTLGGTSDENIPLGNLAAGNYFARVYGYNGYYSTTQCYTLKVITSAANTLAVSPATQSVGTGAGSTTFNVTSNATWAATDNAAWLTVSPASGSNNGILTASFTTNISTSPRTAIITVTGGGITQTATVVQAGVSACVAPTGLNTTNITQNTATLGWNSAPGAISYTIQLLWNGAWIDIGSTTTPSTGIYGLVPNNSYTWRIITVCANNQQSSPSSSATFSTPTAPNCTGGTQWPSTALTPAANWQLQTQIFGGEYCLVNVQNGVTYTFSYCSADGGTLAFDGEISIRTVDDQLLAYSDDICDAIAPKIVWQSNFTGQVRVLLTKYNCLTQATNSTMTYRIGNSFMQDEIEERVEAMPWWPVPAHDLQAFAPAPIFSDKLESEPKLEISIFPNPSSGTFNIWIAPQPTMENFRIQVFDQLGRLFWSRLMTSMASGSNVEVDASDWISGVYTVRILANDGRSEERMVQIHNK